MGKTSNITIGTSILWVALYFCTMLVYTAMDIGIWRKLDSPYSDWLNIATIVIFSAMFIIILLTKNSYNLNAFNNITVIGVLSGILCAVLFFFLLDKCLDPFFEGLFPTSEEAYQQSMLSLLKSPTTSFIHVCILAPVIEEILMRGFVLGGLKNTAGAVIALLLSAGLFALLHFNMVQTFSAFICGLVLGLLYLKTGSLFCCIIAHSGYNIISYCVMITQFNK